MVRNVNGKIVSATGEVVLDIHIGPVKLRESFLVLDTLPYDLLGGMPLCAKSEMIISFPKRTITVQGHSMKLSLNDLETGTVNQGVVYCQENMKIPPSTEVTIPVTVSGNGTCLVEPLSSPPNRPHPSIARALTEVQNNTAYVRIANPGLTPLTIAKGTALGRTTDLLNMEICVRPPVHLESEVDEVQFGTQLDANLRQRFMSLLKEHEHLFANPGAGLGHTDVVEHEINTGNARPVRQNPYRNSITERQTIQDQAAEMLEKGVIRESSSPWSSPVVLVCKDGAWRFCVDYRKLNAVTKKDVHPLPRVDDVVDRLQGSHFFSTLDMASGYWQVPIKEADKEKTAFSTGHGLYEFNVVPFGLCNAPAKFQRMINKVLACQLWKVCLAYLDDIIVFSQTTDEHLRDLKNVLGALVSAGFRLQPKKCHIAADSIKYLGHIIDGRSATPDPNNIRAIEQAMPLKNVKQVRSFLGLCNYYRRFVKDFARISRPLTELTKTGRSWE